MKKIVIISLFLLVAVACKTKRPDVLHISGRVTDNVTGVPIDSVEIYLYYNTQGFGGMGPGVLQKTFYSDKDGRFSFQFSPGDNSSDLGGFNKLPDYKNYHQSVYIDRDKEYQDFNVTLVK